MRNSAERGQFIFLVPQPGHFMLMLLALHTYPFVSICMEVVDQFCIRLVVDVQKDDFLRLVINALRNDLISRNEAFQCLALSFVGNSKSRFLGSGFSLRTFSSFMFLYR